MLKHFCLGLALLGFGAGGCVTTAPKSDIKAASVKVSRHHKAGCKRVSNVTITCKTKKEVKGAIQEKASSMGANFVQLKSLTVGTITGKYKARGIAFICQR